MGPDSSICLISKSHDLMILIIVIQHRVEISQRIEFATVCPLAAIIAGLNMFTGRLPAIYYNICLPMFRFKSETDF